MRGLWLISGALVLACTAVPAPLTTPGDLPPVPGGITDQRPFFGTLKGEEDSSQVVVATCGCGEWKTLLTRGHGDSQAELDVHFYASGDYQPTGSILLYGQEDDRAVSGTIDQDLGSVTGNVQWGTLRASFTATRGTNHDQVVACTLCHVGDKPILPLPADHPAYQLSPANCLNCHQVLVDK